MKVDKMLRTLKQFLPLILLFAGMLGIYVLGWQHFLSFEVLKNNRHLLLDYVHSRPALAAIAYICIYITVVAFSLPGATIATLAGGFLFGQVYGTLYTVVAATIGATLIFLIAKSSLGDFLKTKAAPWFQKMEKGFQKNQVNYLLTIRLIPLFPFFIVNLIPAFLGMRTSSYILATFFGIIPGTAVYISAGVGLGSIFEKNETFSIQSILTQEILIALCGLAVLSLLPILYKWVKRRE